jgi:hypothetical protein
MVNIKYDRFGLNQLSFRRGDTPEDAQIAVEDGTGRQLHVAYPM